MFSSRVHGAFILFAGLAACGGTISGPSDAASDAGDASTDASPDQATTIVCVLSDDAGSALSLACGDWVSVDTIDYELVDGGKKFNHETPCSSGVCIGTSCGVADDSGVITNVGACVTVP